MLKGTHFTKNCLLVKKFLGDQLHGGAEKNKLKVSYNHQV